MGYGQWTMDNGDEQRLLLGIRDTWRNGGRQLAGYRLGWDVLLLWLYSHLTGLGGVLVARYFLDGLEADGMLRYHEAAAHGQLAVRLHCHGDQFLILLQLLVIVVVAAIRVAATAEIPIAARSAFGHALALRMPIDGAQLAVARRVAQLASGATTAIAGGLIGIDGCRRRGRDCGQATRSRRFVEQSLQFPLKGRLGGRRCSIARSRCARCRQRHRAAHCRRLLLVVEAVAAVAFGLRVARRVAGGLLALAFGRRAELEVAQLRHVHNGRCGIHLYIAGVEPLQRIYATHIVADAHADAVALQMAAIDARRVLIALALTLGGL